MTDRENELMMESIRKYKAEGRSFAELNSTTEQLMRQRKILRQKLDELVNQDALKEEIETLNLRILQERARIANGHTINGVLMAVCAEFGVTTSELKRHSNTPMLTVPRHAAFYVLYSLTGCSTPQIGRAIGFHHTSVLHGIRMTEERMKERKFAARIESIKARLEAPKTEVIQ